MTNEHDISETTDDSDHRAEHLDEWLQMFRRMPDFVGEVGATTIDGERVQL